MRTAVPLSIASDDLAELRRWVRSTQLPAVLGQRARILLLAAEGTANTDIAERVGVSRPTVIACRRRYMRRGLAGLPDRPRPGRPQTVRRLRRSEILQVTPGQWFQFVVALRHPDRLIGDCGAHVRADDPRQAEIGFTVAVERQGHGYATEVVRRLPEDATLL